MAILTTSGQVSVYAPRGDPVKSKWEEVSPEPDPVSDEAKTEDCGSHQNDENEYTTQSARWANGQDISIKRDANHV